jgi:hypothetical protein
MAKRGASQYKGQKAVGLGLVGGSAPVPKAATATSAKKKAVPKAAPKTKTVRPATKATVKRTNAMGLISRPSVTPRPVVRPPRPRPTVSSRTTGGGIDLGQIARDILSNVPVIGGAAANPRDIGYPSARQSQRNNAALRRSLGTIKRLR